MARSPSISFSKFDIERVWRTGLALRGLPSSRVPQDASTRLALMELAKAQGAPPATPPSSHWIGPVRVGLPGYDALFPRPAPWRGDARVAVCFTHDVDLFDGLSYFPLRASNWVLQWIKSTKSGEHTAARRTLKRASDWTRHWWRGEDPILGFKPLFDLIQRHDLPSTFFFLSVERALSKEGRLYTFDDQRVLDLMQTLRGLGSEVGLHANRFESASTKGLQAQLRRLERGWKSPIRSVRHHCLTANFPSAWYTMRQAGLTISSNYGHHPPHQGFLHGSAWPHWVGTPNGAILEMPMAVMDVAYGPALARLRATVEVTLKALKETGGVLVLNFHPHYQNQIEAQGVHQQFKEIISSVQEGVRQGWVCTSSLSYIEQILRERTQSGLDT